ncbi:hypothetical protein PASE110613_05100 [Paenibacillus sediminis]|uniref:DinB family protein n=1 Tax=Paenibacillus sediminis TaxID=664909 RepID=A0ABS4H0U4_9BACL|nr:hypothetical protein [Paenibacillus sediminis]MBP1936151.1 hypothetical protein [Paenibacillus sediminis]
MDNQMFRHFLAALSYRTTKAIKGAPDHYPSMNIGKEVRQPVEILNHMTFLMAYVISCYKEYSLDEFRNLHSWNSEVERFYDTLEQLDQVLEEGTLPMKRTVQQLLHGPLADAMTHVGQLTLLRRLADSPVEYENYMNAEIHAGQIRPNQK